MTLPGLESSDPFALHVGVIDWSRVVNKAAAERLLATVTTEQEHRHDWANACIDPLEDAVDLYIATPEEKGSASRLETLAYRTEPGTDPSRLSQRD